MLFNRKPNKICVDKVSEFYNRSTKSWVQDNYIKMYSTHIERKFIVTERFVITLKNKIYKYMALVSDNLYIDKLNDINDKYNNTYSTIKMRTVDVKSGTYFDFIKEYNEKVLNLKFLII